MSQQLNEIDPSNPKVPIRTFNEIVKQTRAFQGSQQSQSYFSSLGVQTRGWKRKAATDIRIFAVQSAATGYGVYICYLTKLSSAEWESTEGGDKIVYVDVIEVEVFNLLENFPVVSGYERALAIGDLITAWQTKDDEGITRWVGLPCVNSPRRAITTQAAPADTKITANLYDFAGVEITSGLGSGINVYCKIVGGGNLNEAIPRLPDNQDIDVYCEQGIWRCNWGFQAIDTTELDIESGKLSTNLLEC